MSYSHAEMVERVRRLVGRCSNQTEAARELGTSPTYLSDILNERRDISEALAKKCGYRREVRFYRIGEGETK